ncbi:hypothetical protein ACVWYH_001622 [Bradyrhizobium sp. GM24.11]
MHYPVLVNPRKPSLSRMPMKKPKKGDRCEGQKGPKNQREPNENCTQAIRGGAPRARSPRCQGNWQGNQQGYQQGDDPRPADQAHAGAATCRRA